MTALEKAKAAKAEAERAIEDANEILNSDAQTDAKMTATISGARFCTRRDTLDQVIAWMEEDKGQGDLFRQGG